MGILGFSSPSQSSEISDPRIPMRVNSGHFQRTNIAVLIPMLNGESGLECLWNDEPYPAAEILLLLGSSAANG